MKTINPQIETLLESMQEQFLQIKQYEGTIPQIELDILLSNLRKTYEFVSKLNQANQKESINLPANAIKKEAFIPSPVQEIQNEPVVKKENTLKVGSTTLPFDTSSTNTVKREMLPLFEPFKEAAKGLPAQEAKTEEITAKKESQLKLRSTTLPFDIPAVNTFKKAPAEEPVKTDDSQKFASEISAGVEPELKAEPKLENNIFTFDVPNITEVKEEPAMAFIEPAEPLIMDFEQVNIEPTNTVNELSEEMDNTILSFETRVADPAHQEVLNISREKIYKEESFVQKIKPLAKIASLFEDTGIAVQEISKESFSLLDKLMKKKEDTSLAELLKHTPISDLKTAIGINEKFQYINELFAGNYEDFNASLDLLNKCRSFTDAEIFIAENLFDKYNWQIDNKSVANFMDLVERRFL